ncbi:hypothetical protein CesoFtcFv8_024905 [Champsocephalus esox]|uniref:Uncharacterized protein n=1 Tax=Champsocephalus esox TaxID=159716 RepID=A0AAN8GE27_9TELE|nr:hypothetical protein CesoFtcFv8_024905 [Champsocephalus esox]
MYMILFLEQGKVEEVALAFIRGLRLHPPLPQLLHRDQRWGKGAQGRAKPKPDPLFRGSDGWKSQGNLPSTPAPVIWPSMCQSSPTR